MRMPMTPREVSSGSQGIVEGPDEEEAILVRGMFPVKEEPQAQAVESLQEGKGEGKRGVENFGYLPTFCRLP